MVEPPHGEIADLLNKGQVVPFLEFACSCKYFFATEITEHTGIRKNFPVFPVPLWLLD